MISGNTKIGGGLFFPHFSGIVINPKAIIGKNCTIFQKVTIGSVYVNKEGDKDEVPVIGDNVVISAGSNIIGNIKIGNNVMIGAGSVVVKDCPDNTVIVGNPAKVISYEGQKHVSLYNKNVL